MSTNAEDPINTVLVGYASAYGSTKGVATRIAERLRAAGHTVELAPVDEVESVETFSAAVVGSAIHNQQWLPPAVKFVQRHTAALSTRPLWMFSVCSVGETTSFLGDRPTRMARRHRKDPATLTTAREAFDLRDHRYFAGAIERGHWSRVGDMFLRLCGGTFGDHRDWTDIDRWSDGIAMSIGGGEGGGPQG